jgi:hypothetical protein
MLPSGPERSFAHLRYFPPSALALPGTLQLQPAARMQSAARICSAPRLKGIYPLAHEPATHMSTQYVAHEPHQHGVTDQLVTQPAGNELQHWTPGPHPAPVPQWHAPAEHVSPVLHLCPHSPQLFTSRLVSTHAPVQQDWLEEQPRLPPQRHRPPSQSSPGLHTSPQEPQL